MATPSIDLTPITYSTDESFYRLQMLIGAVTGDVPATSNEAVWALLREWNSKESLKKGDGDLWLQRLVHVVGEKSHCNESVGIQAERIAKSRIIPLLLPLHQAAQNDVVPATTHTSAQGGSNIAATNPATQTSTLTGMAEKNLTHSTERKAEELLIGVRSLFARKPGYRPPPKESETAPEMNEHLNEDRDDAEIEGLKRKRAASETDNEYRDCDVSESEDKPLMSSRRPRAPKLRAKPARK